MIRKSLLWAVIGVIGAVVMPPAMANARDQIRVVGSATVFPFAAAAAEQFGHGGTFRTPIVESTGTGGGITFKVIPCADVPATLMGVAIDCDTLDPATGANVWDEAFGFWSAYTAPSWLRAEVAAMRAALPGARAA